MSEHVTRSLNLSALNAECNNLNNDSSDIASLSSKLSKRGTVVRTHWTVLQAES